MGGAEELKRKRIQRFLRFLPCDGSRARLLRSATRTNLFGTPGAGKRKRTCTKFRQYSFHRMLITTPERPLVSTPYRLEHENKKKRFVTPSSSVPFVPVVCVQHESSSSAVLLLKPDQRHVKAKNKNAAGVCVCNVQTDDKTTRTPRQTTRVFVYVCVCVSLSSLLRILPRRCL